MAELIKFMSFGMYTWVDQRSMWLDWGAHSRNLVNMIELSKCISDAAFLWPPIVIKQQKLFLSRQEPWI